MSTPGAALRRAMLELLEAEPVEALEPSKSLYEQVREHYGSNAAIADAAGFPTAAQARRAHLERYPHARKTSLERIARDARRARQDFLRNLQRYKTGQRNPERGPGAQLEQLRELRERKITEIRASVDVGSIARRFRDEGVTIARGMSATIQISSDKRRRKNLPPVSFGGRSSVVIPAEFIGLVDAKNWKAAAALFFELWGIAYGLGRGDVTDVDGLVLEIGNNSGAYGS